MALQLLDGIGTAMLASEWMLDDKEEEIEQFIPFSLKIPFQFSQKAVIPVQW